MTTVQFGQRLVRTFGTGSNAKKVLTETLNGKVYTKVLNANGDVVQERVKAFSEGKVGNKFVKTITRVCAKKECAMTKTVNDRVYCNAEKLGQRLSEFKMFDNFFEKVSSIKTTASGNFSEKVFRDNNLWSNNKKGYQIYYNDLGLPKPENCDISTNGKSLKEMIKDHFEAHPDRYYLPEASGLSKLNSSPAKPALSLLDRFI